MSISLEGLLCKVQSQTVSIFIHSSDPLIKLTNAIEWDHMANLAMEDLKKTKKKFWWLGRKISLRTHLSVMILQGILKQTDRGIEESIKNTPLFQLFCGQGIVKNWKCPDHTKIEEFRNRLSPETHKNLGDYVLQLAVKHGFADASWMDIDSTIQQANMAYPSDASLMRKLAIKTKKILNFFSEKIPNVFPENFPFDIEGINAKAKEYFFLSKNTALEKKQRIFAELHKNLKSQIRPVIDILKNLPSHIESSLPWNIARDLDILREKSWRYLLDVAHFIRGGTIKDGKILSFHLNEVSCFSKKKAGKDYEFGRAIQLGRIGGNFLVSFSSIDTRMEDKSNVLPAIEEHKNIFGEGVLKELGADKGYYKGKNITLAKEMNVNTDGLQRPVTVKTAPPEDVAKPLRDRRSGIEPLIGHAKSFGLGKSKMKSDRATLASGYQSVTAFNLHQMLRKLSEKKKPSAI